MEYANIITFSDLNSSTAQCVLRFRINGSVYRVLVKYVRRTYFCNANVNLALLCCSFNLGTG